MQDIENKIVKKNSFIIFRLSIFFNFRCHKTATDSLLLIASLRGR